ncbi:MAG: crossover junction endodeoxyribonuclease RuvC [Bacteroidales bacterium]|nr:crossover junction endodeoxyribonuclease RuvC [Bacteroidales bacterium]
MIDSDLKGQRIILGIDPGSRIFGWGVLSCTPREVTYIAMGVLDLRKESDIFVKIRRIYMQVTDLIDTYHPDELAVEAPFYGKNIQSMLVLGRAQGAAISAAVNRDLPVFEYAPRKVKLSITGRGAASKEQVASILTNMLRIEVVPGSYDATDALAVAFCHSSGGVIVSKKKESRSDWSSFVKQNPSRIK